MGEEQACGGTQRSASGERGEGWWFLADLAGEFIPDSVWLLAMVALVLLIAAAFFAIVFDSFDRTPLQTLGLK